MERSGHVVLSVIVSSDLKDPTSSAVSGLTLLQPVYSSCFLCLLLCKTTSTPVLPFQAVCVIS